MGQGPQLLVLLQPGRLAQGIGDARGHEPGQNDDQSKQGKGRELSKLRCKVPGIRAHPPTNSPTHTHRQSHLPAPRRLLPWLPADLRQQHQRLAPQRLVPIVEQHRPQVLVELRALGREEAAEQALRG